jgi:hypothetical protein
MLPQESTADVALELLIKFAQDDLIDRVKKDKTFAKARSKFEAKLERENAIDDEVADEMTKLAKPSATARDSPANAKKGRPLHPRDSLHASN